jgi:predicted aspartyl protease
VEITMITKVGFRLAGGPQPLILVPVTVNGNGPFEFILDTGAGLTVVSPELAALVGIDATGSKEAMGAGGKVVVQLGTAASITVGGATRRDAAVAISEELSRIAAVVGSKVDGAFGHGFLAGYVVTIDYRTAVLGLADASEPRGASGPSAVPFRLASPAKPLILVPARVNGTGPYQFALDTGASTTVLASGLAQELGIARTGAPAMTGGGGAVAASLGTLRSLALGDRRINNLPIVIADFLSALSTVVGERLDGIVGHNYLREFRVTIDYGQGMLELANGPEGPDAA